MKLTIETDSGHEEQFGVSKMEYKGRRGSEGREMMACTGYCLTDEFSSDTETVFIVMNDQIREIRV